MADNSKALERAKKKTFLDYFFAGVKKGWAILEGSVIPSCIFCYSVLNILQITGLIDLLGKLFNPVMGIFGLPGEAIVSIVAGFFSKSNGCAQAASLFSAGTITAKQAGILLVGNMAYGGIMPQWPRTIVTSGTDTKFHGILIGILVLGLPIGLWLGNLMVAFF